MNLIDTLLNIVALLLWINGRASLTSPPARDTRTAFSPLLRAATPRSRAAYHLWISLLLLLAGRAWCYQRLGAEVGWVASLDLGLISLPFNSISLLRMWYYSIGSFAVYLGAFYWFLLILSVVNRGRPDHDPWQQQVRRQLGWLDRLPSFLGLLVPWFLVASLWYLLSPGLADLGMVARAKSSLHRWQQGFVLAGGALLLAKYLIGCVLFLHVLNSYLYLGQMPLWDYINVTARKFLRLVDWLPLRLGRIDLSPVAMLALVFLGAAAVEAILQSLFPRLPL